ncbi:MAG: ABC transporter ATP-binding protein [Planctomycetes bacterium]|nr:ABC transporter ATP-binding protein [Planctomycetota bacterium]
MVKLSGLRKRFGETIALDGLSLSIEPGEIFGLLGPNGAGKSTAVNICCGLLHPDAGVVRIADAGPPTDCAVRRMIGVAPQELALYQEFTGVENVLLFGRLFGLSGETLHRRMHEALEFVGLVDRRGDCAGVYSGGMKRRLNLAIAIVHQPRLLLLDEPTVGVDPQSRNAILDRVIELKRRGVTIVYTTHYMEEAQKLCDRVAIVDHGRLLAVDTTERLIAQHGGKSAIVIDDNGVSRRIETDDPMAELTRLNRDGGLQNFRVERPNLESVFLNLTGHKLRD